MPFRFVRPDTRTLTISDGDTLVVRARLSSGETIERFQRMYTAGVDGTLTRNPFATAMATVTAYLLDWSLQDAAGHTVPIRDLPIADLEKTLNQLTPESFGEIKDAIVAHEEAMAAEVAAQKKTRPGAPTSLAISDSPPVSGGVTNGSATSMLMSTRS